MVEACLRTRTHYVDITGEIGVFEQQSAVRARVTGPDAARRKRAVSLIWGEVEDDAGVRATSRMRAPEGYTLTTMTSVDVVRRILAGDAPAGRLHRSREAFVNEGRDLVKRLARASL